MFVNRQMQLKEDVIARFNEDFFPYTESSSIDYFVKAKSNFKAHSTATDVEIFVPLPSDVDTPQFNVGAEARGEG